MAAVSIVLDAREHKLVAAMPEAVVKQLDVGDAEILLDGRRALVVERKTLSDLASSVVDGRQREQKARLLATACCPVVFVVESAYGTFAFDERMRPPVGISAKSLQGAVISMTLSARVVFTRDPADTVAFLRRVALYLAKKGTLPPPVPSSTTSETGDLGVGLGPAVTCATPEGYADIRAVGSGIAARKRDNVDARSCFVHMMCQVPGVSAGIAATICAEFGTAAAMYARLLPLTKEGREAAFGALPKVGPKKAATLVEYLLS